MKKPANKKLMAFLALALLILPSIASAYVTKGDIERLSGLAIRAATVVVTTLTSTAATITTGTVTTLTSTTAGITTANITTANVSGALVAPAEVVAATNVLASSECGKTMTLAHATEFVSTLPAPSAGCKFRFIVGLAPASASYTIVTTSSDNIIYGGATSNEIDDATDSNAASSTGSDVITFVDGQAVKGDWVEVWSDGTSWYVNGNSKVRAGITFGQT